jgi:hypothetical protein
MFGNSASRCRQEEILLALTQRTKPPCPPPDPTLELEFDSVFTNSKRRTMMSAMDDLNESMSSICTFDSTDDPVA